MFLEQLAYRAAGFKQESKDVNAYSVATFALITKIHRLLTRPVIRTEGPFPETGSVLVVANHTGMTNVLLAFEAAKEHGRIIRTTVKHTLVDPKAKESSKVLEETGKKDIINTDNPLSLIYKYPVAWFLKSLGVLPVRRGVADRVFLRNCGGILDQEQAAGIFIQQTRQKDGLLNDLQPGPALLAASHPETSLVFMGFYKHSDGRLGLNISRYYTFQELTKGLSDKRHLKDITEVFGNKIAELLPETVQADWESRKQMLHSI